METMYSLQRSYVLQASVMGAFHSLLVVMLLATLIQRWVFVSSPISTYKKFSFSGYRAWLHYWPLKSFCRRGGSSTYHLFGVSSRSEVDQPGAGIKLRPWSCAWCLQVKIPTGFIGWVSDSLVHNGFLGKNAVKEHGHQRPVRATKRVQGSWRQPRDIERTEPDTQAGKQKALKKPGEGERGLVASWTETGHE